MKKILKKSPKRKLVCPHCKCKFRFRMSDIDGLNRHVNYRYVCGIKCPDCGHVIFFDNQGNANQSLYNLYSLCNGKDDD